MLSHLLGLALSSATPPHPTPIAAATWISTNDYPAAALRQRLAGTVGFQLSVGRDGLVRKCVVTQSSSATSLDEATCSLLRLRARFTPATNEAGLPVLSTYSSKVRWVVPIALPSPVIAVPEAAVAANPFGLIPGLRRSHSPSLLGRLPALAVDTPAVAVAVADNASPPTDPAVRSGQLPNGLHYLVMRNSLPRGNVSIRMRVAAGSIDETDAQRGYAHLLEHMTLRGTTHVADGEFGRSLEKMGLRFGIDSNAHTMPEDTTYELDFPATSAPADLTGLFLMREVASRATLAPATLDAERGVVAAELRSRDTPAAREQEALLAFLLAGQRIPTRATEGTEASLAGATAAGLRAFYLANYRPETTTLIVTGDLNPDEVIADITADFSDWRASGAPPAHTDEGVVLPRGRSIRLFTDAGAPDLVEADWVSPFDAAPDTIGRERRDFARSIAAAILNDRLSRVAARPSSPFTAAAMQRGRLYRSAMVTTLVAIPVSGKYAAALAAARIEQRRLIEFGVSQAEVDRVAARMRAAIAQEEARSGTRNTADLANALLASVDSDNVFVSPVQAAADYDRMLASITPADIGAAAAKMAGGSGPLLFASSDKPLPGGAAAILGAFAAADRQSIAASTVQPASAWPYARFGSPGRIVDRRDIADLAVTIVRFANGTSVTIKSVPQPKDDILADLNFGAGLSGLPVGRENSYWLAGAGASLFPQGGLGKADATDIAEELSGKVASVQFGASDDRFHLIGHTRDEDLETQIQLLTAYVADPGFRLEPFQQEKGIIAATLPQVDASSSLVAARDLKQLTHGGDRRWSTLPDAVHLAAAKPDDLAALLRPSLAGPLNLVLVGDMSVDRAIAVAQATIGALPQRAQRPASRDVSFPLAPAEPIIIDDHDRPDRGVAFAAWPTAGFFTSSADARSMQVLSAIIQSRLIDGLRARDGLTYSPMVYVDQPELFSNYGMLAAQVEIAPAKANQFFAEMQKIVTDLATHPVTIEELDRARTPMLDASRTAMFVTNYWLSELVRVDDEPRLLDVIRTRIPDLAAVKAADIQRLAALHLAGKPPLRVIIKGHPVNGTSKPR